jgi:hypothetical protein
MRTVSGQHQAAYLVRTEHPSSSSSCHRIAATWAIARTLQHHLEHVWQIPELTLEAVAGGESFCGSPVATIVSQDIAPAVCVIRRQHAPHHYAASFHQSTSFVLVARPSSLAVAVATTAIIVEAGLVVWPALHPSHYLSHARAAHRIALIPLLACQLLLWGATPPAPPSDRAEGPGIVAGESTPLLMEPAQQPWPMRHLVLAVLQAGRLTLQQDDPQDYALHAGLVMVSGFAAHAWQLVAGSYDHAGSGAAAHTLHVDWRQEALIFLAAYCCV